MVVTVKKRDGKVVPFDPSKIENAVTMAMNRTDKGVDVGIIGRIVDTVKKSPKEVMTVDEIQDIVEKKLMDSKRKDVARKYIKYRQQRDVARQSKTRVMFEEIINTKDNDVTRENANMNADTPAGMMMKFASETTKPFVDNYLLDEDVRQAVQDNYIHIHDKDYYPTKSLTCLQHPLDIIFKRGFRAGHGELRPAKRIETAATQACVSMETVQNEMHGGQSIPAFDFYLAPFVRKAYEEEIDKIMKLLSIGKQTSPDKEYWDRIKNAKIKDYIAIPEEELEGLGVMPAAGTWVSTLPSEERIKQIAINRVVERVHQAMESFIHNMNNIHSRGGNQVVFSSINYGTDTSAEGRCIIRELLLSTDQGVGNGATAIFPIQIWKLKSGVSYLPTDPNYDLYKLACKVTAHRFFPNFVNLDTPFNQHPKWNENDPERYKYEVVTMGCRTRVFNDIHGESTSIGRGNLSFTTLNFPKLAIEAAIEAGVLVKAKDVPLTQSESVHNMTVPSSTRSAEKALLVEQSDQQIKPVPNGYVSVWDDDTYSRLVAANYAPEISESEKKARSEKAVTLFFEKFEKYLSLAAKQLKTRYEFQCTAKAKQFPLLMSGLWMGSEKLNPEDEVRPVLKHGSLSIGFIGLAETLKALIGKHHGESEEAQELGLKIVGYLNKRCKDFTDIHHLNFTAFATPAEGLSGKFTVVDAKEFGFVKGITDKQWYTNSNHVPVEFKIPARKKIELEAPYNPLTPAGHITYVEIDYDATKNPEAIEDLVTIAHDNNVGYFSINHDQVRCDRCSYESSDSKEFGEGDILVCPKCGSHEITYLARITGYLTTDVRKWNTGKKAEFYDRVDHDL